MFKKSLLLTLLLALLVPWAANAQGTLTVCEGTTQNQFIPFYAYSGDTQGCNSEFIIPASELTALNGKTITAITFSVAQQQSKTWTATYNVYLAEVSSTTLTTTLGPSAGTIVYTGTVDASSSEMTITFDDDYTYNGGNLLVGTYVQTAGAWDSSGKFYGIEAEGAAYITGTWGGNDDGGVDFIPQTTFTYLTDDPWISLNTSSMIVITGSTQDLTASYGNVTGTPTIIYSSSNSKVASVTGSGTTATVTGVSAGTATITATMVYNATNYYATCDVTVEEPSYCKPSFSNTSDYIKSFTTTGGEQNIDNQNTGQGTGGYSNFYDTHFVSAEPETEIGFSVVRGYDDNYNYAIWVDWNKDYEFDNTTEKVAYTTSSTGDWTGSFTIPAATAAGDYHMRVLQVYSSAATPCVSASYGEGEDYKLTVLAGNPYQKPVNLQVSSLTGTSATITWDAPNTDVVGYKYQYQPQGGDWTALTSTTALSAQLPVLTSNTTYTFQVQAIYAGDNESGFASKSFTTLIAIPYEYGFEDATEFNKWETADCEDDITNGLSGVVNNTDYAHSGDNFFAFSSYNGATDPQYLISPALSGIANGLHVSFYYRSANNNDPETFMVGYSTTDTDPDSFTWSDEVTCPDGSYYPYAVNFMVPEIKYIAVKYTTADSYYLFVDDFTFEEAPDCLEPTNVIASNITTTSADITWTNGGSETSWDIFATDDSTIVPDGTTTPTVEGVTTKPHQLTLQPGTTYYVYVRAACSSTETSAWSSPAVFHTNCEGMDLPYGPYGFEDGALTVCWNLLSTNTAYNTMSINTNTSYVHTGSKSLLMHSGSYTGDFVLALPIIDDSYSLSDYRFVFWAMAANTDLKVTIGIMEDPNDMTTFVAQNEEFNPASEFTEYKVPFSGYTGDGQYVAIKVSRASGSSSGNVYFDDIAIELTPSCIEPSGLTVSNETAHGATFSWTNGGSETEWHLYFGKNNTAPADDIDLSKVTVANSNPFTMTTGLDPETDYYVWVRANCGSTDGYSMWVGPKTFTTGIACPAPTGLAYSEVTNHTAKLSWTGTSESYVLSVGTYDYTATPVTGTILEEGFESWSVSATPTGWTHLGAGTIGVQNPSATHVHGGSKVFRFNGTTSDNIAVLPYYGVETNQLTIDFWMKAEGSYSGSFEYGYVTDPSDATTFVKLGDYSASTSTSYQHVENLSMASAPDGARIAFLHKSGSSSWYWFIDDLTITGPTYPIAWNTYNTTDLQKTVEGLLANTPYFAKVKGNCGTDGDSQETSVISFTTDIACPAPTALTPSNPSSSSFDLQWTNGGSEDWIVAYKKTTDADFTEKAVNISQVTVEASLITYTLSGLEAETEYTVKVRDNCEASYVGDGMSEWTAEVPYSTIAACSALNPVVDPASITHHNATVNFEGESATGFNVYYRTAAGINASFSETLDTPTAPTGWGISSTELTDDVLNGTTTINSVTSGWSITSYGLGSYNVKMNIWSTSKYWLITPSIIIGTNNILNFDAAITKYNDDIAPASDKMPDANSRFVVLITTDNQATWTILREWNNTGSADVLNNISNTGNNFTIDLSSYKDETVKIAFYGGQTSSGPDCDLHIDNVMVGVATTPGAWETEAATGTTANLSGLTAGTKYDLKVVPNCDPTQESNTVQFTTLSANDKYFLTAGDWATATNWMDNEMPAITDNAIIRANATINNGIVAAAKKITFGGATTPTLTINDGGQLQTDNNVTATVKKSITSYTSYSGESIGGYYLISTPINTIYGNASTYGMITDNLGNTATSATSTYDLYYWNRSQANEWRNYRNSVFDIANGTGYLYASKAGVELTFTGTVKENKTDVTKNPSYTEASGDTEFSNWNLYANPFVCNAYITAVNSNESETPMAFYKMNDAGDNFEAATGAIKPMEGVFVQATKTGQSFKFSRTAPVTSTGNLNIHVAQVVNSRDAHRSTDNAIIRFGEGNTLEKFSFNANNAKVYIPQDGKDYAVVNAANEGEMPVYFKAAENGSYTISFNAENVEFSYLHLIDNLTGNEVNLLETPSYSFDARTIDYASRFKLVFVTGQANMGDDFGFFDANGNLMILGIEGTATLQMIDVTGRIISSETFSGNYSKAINAKAGVYMLRLIQGNDVRTQKIVVK